MGPQVCPDQKLGCPSGYFCVDNVLCLKGSPSQYSPLALLTAGAIAELISEKVNVDCIAEIEATVEDLVTAFESYEARNYGTTKSALKKSIKDVEDALLSCNNEPTSWYGWVKKVVTTAVQYYAPEVYAGYIVLKDGVNVFEDFASMMRDCSDSERNYIACGEDFGKLIYQIYKSV